MRERLTFEKEIEDLSIERESPSLPPLMRKGESAFRQRIVEIAKREWNNWEEGKLSETDLKARPLLKKYLMNYSPGGYTQSQAEEKIKKRTPWSAVFISYIMREAGAGNAFTYSSAHTTYIAAAKKARNANDVSKFLAYRISEVIPEVGDLVCRDRERKPKSPCAGTSFDNVERGGISHSDIVVEVQPKHIVILGGNTRQLHPKPGLEAHTAGQRKIKLDKQGYVIPDQTKCKYFAIMKPPSAGAVPSVIGQATGTAQDITSLPLTIQMALRAGNLTLEVALAILSGNRDVNDLTNRVFYALYPKLRDKKLKRDDPEAKVWIRIRDVIQNLLGKVSPAALAPQAIIRSTSAAADRVQVSAPSASHSVATPNGIPKLSAGLTPPVDLKAYRKFRLTTYHVAEQSELPTGSVRVPIYNDQGHKIAEGSPEFFAKLSVEGSARLMDGRLINVTGKKVPVSHGDYAEVLAYHRQAYAKHDKKRREEGKEPTPTGYSGIIVENGRVVRALAFHEVQAAQRGVGYGVKRRIPLVPFRTLAADIGHIKYKKVEPKWKGEGGLVPPGTHVYIKEYDGLRLPDGTTHDGWFIVNDTGGGIFGAHFDVFVGTQALRKKVKLPEFGQVWFAGIEQRIPQGYMYGLRA